MPQPLTELTPGMPIVFGGDKVTHVSDELARVFEPGDRLVVVQDTGDLLHIRSEVWSDVDVTVARAAQAFADLKGVADAQISQFFTEFAARIEDDGVFGPVLDANADDVAAATSRGRPTTRLALSPRMRSAMAEGLRMWADGGVSRGAITETVEHDGWRVDQIHSGLGVVGFVFEGRPNVFADAAGVLTTGNTAVLRIGSDALGTARAITESALKPAMEGAGLPSGSMSLIDQPGHASAWALFSNSRLSLAIARGSGPAVAQLGAVARQSGIPVSLHGTGGAWLVAAESADPEAFASAVKLSLDRKVCNTLNTVCIVGGRSADLIPVFLDALDSAGNDLGSTSKLHVTSGHESLIPDEWREVVTIARSNGVSEEPRTEVIPADRLGHEWEWDRIPEVTLTIVDDVDQAIDLFNTHSPKFIASLISEDGDEHQAFFERIDAPFVGNGFTRWVDGQFALSRPELGLSNWQFGRLFARGAILSGDSVFTERSRVTQADPHLGR